MKIQAPVPADGARTRWVHCLLGTLETHNLIALLSCSELTQGLVEQSLQGLKGCPRVLHWESGEKVAGAGTRAETLLDKMHMVFTSPPHLCKEGVPSPTPRSGRWERMFDLALTCFDHCSKRTRGHFLPQEGSVQTLGFHLHLFAAVLLANFQFPKSITFSPPWTFVQSLPTDRQFFSPHSPLRLHLTPSVLHSPVGLHSTSQGKPSPPGLVSYLAVYSYGPCCSLLIPPITPVTVVSFPSRPQAS